MNYWSKNGKGFASPSDGNGGWIDSLAPGIGSIKGVSEKRLSASSIMRFFLILIPGGMFAPVLGFRASAPFFSLGDRSLQQAGEKIGIPPAESSQGKRSQHYPAIQARAEG